MSRTTIPMPSTNGHANGRQPPAQSLDRPDGFYCTRCNTHIRAKKLRRDAENVALILELGAAAHGSARV